MSDNFAQVSLTELLSSVAINPPSALPVVNRATATMDAIKFYIQTHQLKPGDPLPTEAELGADIGVSRSSVREALRKLEALDIVQVKHGSGTFVGTMSLEPMVQTLALRASLSGAGNRTFLRQVALTRKALDIGVAHEVTMAHRGRRNEELDAIVARMLKLASKGKSFMQEDIAFHDLMLGAIGNELVRQCYSAFWLVHTAILPDLVTREEGAAYRTALAHESMLSAAYVGDQDAYCQAIGEHYQPLLEALGENSAN